MTGKFEVHQYCLCGGWQNTWRNGDEPQQYETREAAQADITEFLDDIAAQIRDGKRDEDGGYSPDEFMIVEVT